MELKLTKWASCSGEINPKDQANLISNIRFVRAELAELVIPNKDVERGMRRASIIR